MYLGTSSRARQVRVCVGEGEGVGCGRRGRSDYVVKMWVWVMGQFRVCGGEGEGVGRECGVAVAGRGRE